MSEIATGEVSERREKVSVRLPLFLREAIAARVDAAAREGISVDATAVIGQALDAYLSRPFSLDALTAGRVLAVHPRMDLLQGSSSKTGTSYKLPPSLVTAMNAHAAEGTEALRLLGGDGHITITDVLAAALAVELVGSPVEVIDEHRAQLLATLRDQDPR